MSLPITNRVLYYRTTIQGVVESMDMFKEITDPEIKELLTKALLSLNEADRLLEMVGIIEV